MQINLPFGAKVELYRDVMCDPRLLGFDCSEQYRFPADLDDGPRWWAVQVDLWFLQLTVDRTPDAG